MTGRAQARGEISREGRTSLSSVFKGRTALVVGGSGGIGKAVSLELASRGASVLVHGKSGGKVDSVVLAIRQQGGTAAGLALDIDSPDSLLAALPPSDAFDILVVAFGPFVQKTLALHTQADWEKMALLDLALPGALASRFLPSMIQRGFGRILFFGGTRTDATRGFLTNAAYAAAKTGLNVLAKSIALEGRAHNVAAVTVCPGFVDTEYLTEATKRQLRSIAPNGTLIGPEDVAALALDILDRDPCIASGAVVSLDAGLTRGA